MTKSELSEQIESFLLLYGAQPDQAATYAQGFPVQYSQDTLDQMRNVNDWDLPSKRELLTSFSRLIAMT